MVEFMNYGILKPWRIAWIVAVFVGLWVFMKFNFLKLNREAFKKDEVYRKKVKRFRRWILFSRTLVVLLLLISLALPYLVVKKETEGIERIVLLKDNSKSMEVFDNSPVDSLEKNLGQKAPLSVYEFGENLRSNVGDALLEHLEKNVNLLLISDGNSNEGAELDKALSFASSIGATVSVVKLPEVKKDVSVKMEGQRVAVEDTQIDIKVIVNKLGIDDYNLRVSVDGVLVDDLPKLQSYGNQDIYVIKKSFKAGDHEILAKVDEVAGEFRKDNNVFYKVVHVVEKPKILYVTEKNDPFKVLLDKFYDVDSSSYLLQDLSKYYAVVVNDVEYNKLSRNIDSFGDYLLEGNGAFFVGGLSSFDRGYYKGTLLENYLPVKVGASKEPAKNSNIILIVDISSSTTGSNTATGEINKTSGNSIFTKNSYQTLGVSKAEAIDIIKKLNSGNNVGVIAFTQQQSFKVWDISNVGAARSTLIEKISQLQPPALTPSASGNGMLEAFAGAQGMFEKVKGSKNIIFLTDGVDFRLDRDRMGNSEYMTQKRDVQNQLTALTNLGISLNLVTIKKKDYLANHFPGILDGWNYHVYNSGGQLMDITNKQRLIIQFGDPEKEGDGKQLGLLIWDPFDVITRGLKDPRALMSGYNQVSVKDSAKNLVKLSNGLPALSVSYYGIGRVGAWTAFSGNSLGEMLNENNSALIVRSINWAVGDPERKKEYSVDIEDTREGESGKITVVSDKFPVAEGIEFVETVDGNYEASFLAKEPGFHEILGRKYAVNYAEEWQDLGYGKKFLDSINAIGGKEFNPEDVDKIVEFAKSVSRKGEVKREDLRKYFLLAALLILLIEIGIRRFMTLRFK